MAVATVAAILGATAAIVGTGAAVHGQRRARAQAKDAKDDARNSMMRAEREKQLASDRAEADSSRDISAIRRRLLGSFGRGANLMKAAPTQDAAFGKSLIGS